MSKPVKTKVPNAADLLPLQPGLFASLENEGSKRDAFLNDLHQRNQGLISKALGTHHVLVVGAGSVGSGMAETLTRAGLGQFTLIDPDKVETHNLTRSAFAACDVGKPKVDALARILKAINPWVQVETQPKRLEDVAKRDLKAAIKAANLIICAADDKLTQAKVNRIAVHHKKPLVSVGVYAGARGGEVVLVAPDTTPCLECALNGRRFDESRSGGLERTTDYGTGRLKPTVGLGCDIQFVTNAASKLVLSFLSAMSPGQDADAPGTFVIDALRRGENLIIFGMSPDFWFLPEAMGTAAGQYAFQSVWLQTEAQRDCPVCSATPSSSDPIDDMQTVPRLEIMRLAHDHA